MSAVGNDNFPWAGAVFAGGTAAVVRIPVPGTDNLAIELSPRNFKGRSTSALFIQDPTGRRVLRLDYHLNPRTNMVDYHWNQRGTTEVFGITDHTPAGRGGRSLYMAARGFKYLGRALIVFGIAMDTVSIVRANKPLRRATEVVSAWGMAVAGAEGAGALGAGIGMFVGPEGAVMGGLVFGFVGGVAGYLAGEKVGGIVYDWAEDTLFERLQEVPPPGGVGDGVGTSPYQEGGPGLPHYRSPSSTGNR
jgi:hypothetical protein